MKRSRLIPILLGLGGTGCGEVTAFCMSAGAPSGATLQVTTVQTSTGPQVVCGPAPLTPQDSLPATAP